MRTLLSVILLLSGLSARAEKSKGSYVTEDIAKLIENYSKASGKIFILDPGVRGKITLFNPGEVTLEQSFNQLSHALSIHGYAIVKSDQGLIVRPSRAAQRDHIETTTELPSITPERMVTWIFTPKYISATDFLRNFRNITTKDGDINALPDTNQVIVSDYTSNLHRIAELLKVIDRPIDPAIAKIVEYNLKKEEQARQDRLQMARTKE